MAVRALRSIAMGGLVVDFVLYLRVLGWSAVAIGGLLAAAGLFSSSFGLVVGVLSDRFGRRPFLIAYVVATALLSAGVIVAPRSFILPVAAVLIGYGRGQNGNGGPIGPVEQAWLARQVPDERRVQVFSLNTALSYFCMGLGAFFGAAVPFFTASLGPAGAYVPLFAFTALIGAVNAVQIWTVREEVGAEAPRAAEGEARRSENRALFLLTGVNMLNGLGLSLFSPLLPYWFAVRFGVGPDVIAPVFGLTFLLSGFSSLASGELARRIGIVRSIVWVRLVAVALLLVLPLAPSYAWAASAYLLRGTLNRSSVGLRQAFGVGLVRDRRRGFAGSLNALSTRLPSSIGPAIGGWLMGEGSLELPFFLGAVLQFSYVVLFGLLLGRYAQPAAATRQEGA